MIGGGFRNCTTTIGSFVGAGCTNIANGVFTTVVGGSGNTATCASFVGGGTNNNNQGRWAFIGGGCGNSVDATGICSTIGGGNANNVCGSGSFIGGGDNNSINSNGNSVIGGGCYNCACGGQHTLIGGGKCNVVTGFTSSIVGGCCNCITAPMSFIGGGNYNQITNSVNVNCSAGSTIAGGIGNNTYLGTFNTTTFSFTSAPTVLNAGLYSTIGGGFQNNSCGQYSFVGGGKCNVVTGFTSSIVGGCCNCITAPMSFIGGGNYNQITNSVNVNCSAGSTIAGGIGNNTYLGTFNTTTFSFTSAPTVLNAGLYSTIGGGFQNNSCGQYSFVGGGGSNNASGPYSSIEGGRCGFAQLRGQRAYSSKEFAELGDAQHSFFVLSNTTNDTSLVTLYLDGTTATAPLVVPNNKIYCCIINVGGSTLTGGDVSTFLRQVAIKNVGGTVSLVGAVTTIGTDKNLGGYSLTIDADTSNDSLRIRVGGDDILSMRWVAVVDAVDMQFTINS